MSNSGKIHPSILQMNYYAILKKSLIWDQIITVTQFLSHFRMLLQLYTDLVVRVQTEMFSQTIDSLCIIEYKENVF